MKETARMEKKGFEIPSAIQEESTFVFPFGEELAEDSLFSDWGEDEGTFEADYWEDSTVFEAIIERVNEV